MRTNVVNIAEASTNEEYSKAYEHARGLYCTAAKPDAKQIGATVGVNERTVRRWIEKDEWKAHRAEFRASIDESFVAECGSPADRSKQNLELTKQLKECIALSLKDRNRNGIWSTELQALAQVLKTIDELESKIYTRLGVV